MTIHYQHLLGLSRPELEELMVSGHPIQAGALDDTEYRGLSLGLPEVVQRHVQKFKKTFYRDPRTRQLRGWNIRMKQNALHSPWIAATVAGRPITYGHYRVVRAAEHERFRHYPQALLIDYGQGHNRPWDPTSRLRDYIVSVAPGDSDLLLGRMYLDLGLTRPATPSYFLLMRDGPVQRVVDPPRA